jgi:hypothetical protein
VRNPADSCEKHRRVFIVDRTGVKAMARPDETGGRSGAEEGSRADYGTTSIHQRLATVTGPVVQATKIAGDVTISVSNAPACCEVPIVVSVRHHDGWSQVVVDGDPPELVPTCKTIDVLVEGRGPQAVVLHGLRPVILTHRPPQPAWEVPRPIVEPAPMHVRPFIGHLGPSPRIDPPVGEPNFPFTVTASDPEQFTIVCYGAKEDTEWQLELDWTCAGRHGTVVINAEEKPFRLYPQVRPSPVPPRLIAYLLDHGPSEIKRQIAAWQAQVEMWHAD